MARAADDLKDRELAVPAIQAAAGAVLLCLAVLASACGGTDKPGPAGSSDGGVGEAMAYARCMRSHGLRDFPDPTAGPGGGYGFQINGGPGSDLDHNSPRFSAADHACQGLLPGAGQGPPVPAQKLAAEVKWAHCMRSHGLPGFPGPDARGAFDSSRFDDSSSTFQSASQACHGLEPSGPMTAVPGPGSAS